MPFPHYQNKFEVQSNILGPTLRTLIKKLESALVKTPDAKISDLVDNLDIVPMAKFQYYALKSKVIIETDLSQKQIDSIHEQLSEKIKSQVPKNASGELLTADTMEGITLFNKVRKGFQEAVKENSLNMAKAHTTKLTRLSLNNSA